MNPAHCFAAVCLLGLSNFVLACDARQPENFSVFFSAFASDKPFAVSRTIYPSARVRYEYVIEEGRQQIIENRRKVTREQDLNYPALREYMQSVGLESKPLEVAENEAVVEMYKPGSHELLSYHFMKKRGCWYLREIQVHLL